MINDQHTKQREKEVLKSHPLGCLWIMFRRFLKASQLKDQISLYFLASAGL